MSRYQVTEGIVIRRKALPKGDVVVTLFGERGKLQALTRKAKRLGGNPGKLSLFHDVSVQTYRKGEDDLSIITQVQLNGALPGLSRPEAYGYAHVLAELVDKLSVDVHVGGQMYNYLASGLRGLSASQDPEAVGLVYAWKLLSQAGLAPRVTRCAVCGSADLGERFDSAAGGLTCVSCNVGMRLSPDVIEELQRILTSTVREGLEPPPTDRTLHWAILSRYTTYHIAELKSLGALRSYRHAQATHA